MGCFEMDINFLEQALGEQNYDIRVTGNGRWIDQKCALDAVCFVAECIITYVQDGGKQPFQVLDIWHSDYAKENLRHIVGKYDPTIPPPLEEYNKFFRQSLKMFASAGILDEELNKSLYFTILKKEVLEYIAQKERNTFDFLCIYIEKTLRDSDLWGLFETFFELETQEAFADLKNKFSEFCINYTNINTETESNRIFSKVLNPLACKFNTRGMKRGRLSKLNISYDRIMYNRTNWREDRAGKNKIIDLGDFIPAPINDGMFEFRIRRAINHLQQHNATYNASRSGIVDELVRKGTTTYMHHIFPKHQFRNIADFIENLIPLNAAQHYQKAHPDGNTSAIDREYQYLCLLSKINSIKRNLVGCSDETKIYKFRDFMYVLDTGLNTNYFSALQDYDFNSTLIRINRYYSNSV